jgi:hypothetical protein
MLINRFLKLIYFLYVESNPKIGDNKQLIINMHLIKTQENKGRRQNFN